MIHFRSLIKPLALSSLICLSVSCKKQLEFDPRGSIDGAVALSSKAGITNAINSAYAVLKGEVLYGRDMFAIPEAMSDLTFANGRSNRLIGENNNRSLSNVVNWQTAYSVINEINLILEAMVKLPDATPEELARWEGELKFLRALYMFDLVKNYAYIPTAVVQTQDRGGIVIPLKGIFTVDDAINYRPKRASIRESYDQIFSDLYASMRLLSNTNRGRNYASKASALFLGSRVALYDGKWVRADSMATAALAAIPNSLAVLSNTTNYVQNWRVADHPEGVFQVWYATIAENIGVNTSLAATHTTLATPGGFAGVRQGQGDLVPNAFLLGQLGISGFPNNLVVSSNATVPTLNYSNDIRNRLFEFGANAAGRYVECTKWLGKNGSPNWDNTVVLRLPELYLNRAEARYHQGLEDQAWADLNVIRTNRIIGFTAPATRDLSGTALLDEILRQRMLEFAFEGQRFYDLKRYGRDIVKTSPAVNLPATDFRYLPRIPLRDTDGNPDVPQNFGY